MIGGREQKAIPMTVDSSPTNNLSAVVDVVGVNQRPAERGINKVRKTPNMWQSVRKKKAG
jgi:hypothetical protein